MLTQEAITIPSPPEGVVLLPFQEWFIIEVAKRGWSYEVAAARLSRALRDRGRRNAHCSRTTIMGYVHGKALPSPDLTEAVATIFETTVQEVHDLVWESDKIRAQRQAEWDEWMNDLWRSFGHRGSRRGTSALEYSSTNGCHRRQRPSH